MARSKSELDIRRLLKPIDVHFCRFIAHRSALNGDVAMSLLIDAMAKGNGDYVGRLCGSVGHPFDMRRATSRMLAIGTIA
jgi:hypothetical protein